MSWTVLVRAAGCAVAVLLALPCVTPVHALAQPLIRLGVSQSDAFSEGYYAEQIGFFKKAGLNIEVTPFRSGATILTGVEAGNIDIGVANVPVLAREIGGGTPLVIVAGGGMYSTRAPISALCVPGRDDAAQRERLRRQDDCCCGYWRPIESWYPCLARTK